MSLLLQVTSVSWKENELNMVDTPGHADFGGEVCCFYDSFSSELFFSFPFGLNKVKVCQRIILPHICGDQMV